MLFYARKKVDNTFELITFPDGRPVPGPFRRLVNEDSVTRDWVRRPLHKDALKLAGYSEEEYHGKVKINGEEIQARLSERFEDTHFMGKIDANSVYLVDVPCGNQNADNKWNEVKKMMGDNDGIDFKVPDHMVGKCKNTGKYLMPTSLNAKKEEKKEVAEKIQTPVPAARPETDEEIMARVMVLSLAEHKAVSEKANTSAPVSHSSSSVPPGGKPLLTQFTQPSAAKKLTPAEQEKLDIDTAIAMSLANDNADGLSLLAAQGTAKKK